MILMGNREGNQSSPIELKGELQKIDYQLTTNEGGGGGGKCIERFFGLINGVDNVNRTP